MKKKYFVGVDVSKKTLDLALLDEHGEIKYKATISNTKSDIEEFFKVIQSQFPDFDFSTTVVCLEHTGIYSQVLMDFLVSTPMKICVEMALQIQQSQGIKRGKNDSIDALRIAQYAHSHQGKLRWWVPVRSVVQKLKALLTLRDRLVRVKTQLKVPLNEVRDFLSADIQKALQASSKASLKAIEKDLQKVEKDIHQLIGKDESLKKQFKFATSVVGVGPVIASYMIVTTNEFKCISEAKQYACYAGVAPFPHTSGTSVKGKAKVSKLANMNMKKLLTQGARSAIQHSAELKAYYERKIAQGKPPMNVINAVRNKLISRVFACIRNERAYEKIYKNAVA